MTLEINQTNFSKEILEEKLPVVIDFWAEWCGPCRMMAPVFEELSQEYGGKAKFAKLNTQYNEELAVAFGISSIPTTVVVYQNKEVGRMVGFAPKHIMKSQLDKMLEQAYAKPDAKTDPAARDYL